MKDFKIAVLSGGISSEREVSLISGKFVLEALQKNFVCEPFILDKNELPAGLNPDKHVVFAVTHGEYGEDGTLQAQLEGAGFSFAGSGSLASRVCMNKPAAKALLKQAGIKVAKELVFNASEAPNPNFASEFLGEKAILKPADKGSSVGLKIISSKEEMASALKDLPAGLWMLEEFYKGREFSVGVLEGKAAGIVEIKPEGGVYDFKRKYTKGATVYEFPASVSKDEELRIKRAAETAFAACGCRDFARVDFLMKSAGDFIALEINTLPGMTPTSLLPKSASCIGLDFDGLCKKMVSRAAGEKL